MQWLQATRVQSFQFQSTLNTAYNVTDNLPLIVFEMIPSNDMTLNRTEPSLVGLQ